MYISFQMVTISIMIYYGPKFFELENNDVDRVEDYVATIMSEINQGFANTDIPLKAELLCLKYLEIDDDDEVSSSGFLVERFRNKFGMLLFISYVRVCLLLTGCP